MDAEVKQRNRRRKRAQRMQAQRDKTKNADSNEEDESPVREKTPRPPIRRKKSKDPLAEEDIIDGFAIYGFRSYEDLEVSQPSYTRAPRGPRPPRARTEWWPPVAPPCVPLTPRPSGKTHPGSAARAPTTWCCSPKTPLNICLFVYTLLQSSTIRCRKSAGCGNDYATTCINIDEILSNQSVTLDITNHNRYLFNANNTTSLHMYSE